MSPPHAPGYRIDRYRPRVEALFARIERWTRIADGDVHWRSVTRDNHHHLVRRRQQLACVGPGGTGPGVQLADLSEHTTTRATRSATEYPEEDGDRDRHRAGPRTPSGRGRTYRQPVPQADPVRQPDPGLGRDPHRAGPARSALDVRGGVRLRRARPGLADSRGDPGDWPCRDDPFSSYRAGFEVRTYRLCRRVLMFHQFPGEPGIGADCLVRSIDFGYSPGGAVGMFLTSVTQRGYRRNEAGPRLPGALAATGGLRATRPAVLHDEVIEVDRASLANLPAGLAADRHQWADLDGEGIPGMLASRPARGSTSRTWAVPGSGRSARCRRCRAPPVGRRHAAARPRRRRPAGRGHVRRADAGLLRAYRRTAAGPRSARSPRCPQWTWPIPNLRFVDLDGDGHADLLVTEHEALTWYPSPGRGRVRPALALCQAARRGRRPAAGLRRRYRLAPPRRPVRRRADATWCAFATARSATGRTSGYGRFGREGGDGRRAVVRPRRDCSTRAPAAGRCRRFGATDLVYLGADGVRVYLNRSGNGWADAGHAGRRTRRRCPGFGAGGRPARHGTTCLVWSLARARARRAGQCATSTCSAARSRTCWCGWSTTSAPRPTSATRSSTAFYLADKAAGRPWVTRLAFPVQVVERVETLRPDQPQPLRHPVRVPPRLLRRHRARVPRLRHGGAVGHRGARRAGRRPVMAEATNVDPVSHVPPVLTRTWYHTGAFVDEGAMTSRRFAQEYWHEPALTEEQRHAMLLDDTPWPTVIRRPDGSAEPYPPSAVELREACRAMKGSILRQEVYALDGTEGGRPALPRDRTQLRGRAAAAARPATARRVPESFPGGGHAALRTPALRHRPVRHDGAPQRPARQPRAVRWT